MAFELTSTAENLASFTEVKPNLILEIEGIEQTFSAGKISKLIRIGDDCWFIGKTDTVIGGVCQDEDALDYISLQGSSTSIGQQLFQDKGGSSSITRANIKIIDKDNRITKLFQPEDTIDDILAANCKLYLGFEDGAHPRDSINILNGLVSDVKFGAGFVTIAIAHPKELQRQVRFNQANTKLSTVLGETENIVRLESAKDLLLPAEGLRTFVRVNDEVIEYFDILNDELIPPINRGSLLTTAVQHEAGDDVVSFYELSGHPIDLALRLLLSNGGVPKDNMSNLEVESFNFISPFSTRQNAILFDNEDIENDLNLQTGDLVTVTGSTNPANNVTNRPIIDFGIEGAKSYIVLQGDDFVDENDSPATISIVSQFNVLPEGAAAGLRSNQVDIAQFLNIKDTFSALFPDMRFYLKEEINVKDFIDEQILFPCTLYSIPRAGKISVGITIPPLANTDTKFLTSSNVVNPQKIVIERSINQRLYNAVVYKVEEDVLEDKFLRGEITISNDSNQRIPIGNRPLTIEAKGLREDDVTINFVQNSITRLLDRYKFGASQIKLELLYGEGFNLEVGDTVVFGDDGLQVSDDTDGTRSFSPRIMELVDKKLNYKTGKINITLWDTAYRLDGRFTVVSPSSKIAATGSTTTSIKVEKSFGTKEFDLEKVKWEDHVGQRIAITNANDPAVPEEITNLIGFDAANPNCFLVSPPLSFVPDDTHEINIPQYPLDTDPKLDSIYKVMYGHVNPSISVLSGASSTVFDVNPSDTAKLFVGSIVELHNEDYSDLSPNTTVIDITGDTITVEDDLGFTPDNTYTIELVGFPDQGKPYRIL